MVSPRIWLRVLLAFSLLMIFIVCLALLPVSIAFSLVMPDLDIPAQAIDKVSGYYGPGSVMAWLVLGLSNIEFKLLLTASYRLLRGRKTILIDDFAEAKVDAAILGTVAYPLVAFGDNIVRVFTIFRSQNVVESMGELLQAPLAITHLSSVLSILAMYAHIHFLLHLNISESDRECSDEVYQKIMRKRRARLALWTMVFVSSQFWLSMLSFSLRSNTISTFKHYCKMFATVSSAAVVFLSDSSTREVSSSLASLYCIIVAFIVLPKVTLNVEGKYGTRFAFPRTSAKLSDLDQAAALGVALCTVSAGMVESIVHWIERRHASASGEDDLVTNDQSNPSVGLPIHQRTTFQHSHSKANTDMVDELDVTDADKHY